MVKGAIKRRKYFVNYPSQIKFILLSVFPATLLGFFCTFYLSISGDLILKTQKAKMFTEFVPIRQSLDLVRSGNLSIEARQKVEDMHFQMIYTENAIRASYFDMLKKWNTAKTSMLDALALSLLAVLILAILYSHRIAGPLYRLKRSIDFLSQGINVASMRFRANDEFKELGESMDKLRIVLKERGFIK